MRPRRSAVILFACCVSAASPVHAQSDAELEHVRGATSKARSLLQDGSRLSATFEALVDALERSDVLVWIETRNMRLPAQLMLVAAPENHRHVRISISVPGLDADLIAWLGHELQHAVEISAAPQVRDQDSLRRLYQSIGTIGSVEGHAETAKAQQVWGCIVREVRASRNAPSGKP